MTDPFELCRLMWSTAISRGLESLAEAVPGAGALESGRQADSIDFTPFTAFGRIRIELPTMLLLERKDEPQAKTMPVLIVAPYAVHDALIADFADRHSVAQILAEEGSDCIALTYWRSATAEMRHCGIDAYLSDLNVAIDDLGGPVVLVGLCQGGWLAAAYAARFPGKVAKLVLAGAPIDISAAETRITRTLFSFPTPTITQGLVFGGGRVSGPLLHALWSDVLSRDFTVEAALQCRANPTLEEKFNAWNARIFDLPGAYFLQTAEWIFRENRLARGSFPSLGRQSRLPNIKAPVFVLAAADDEVVAVAQATAVASLCTGTNVEVRVEPGRHLSLFMGRRTLDTAWRDIARWLTPPDAAAASRLPPLALGKR